MRNTSLYDRIKPRADHRAERISDMTARLLLAIPFVTMILVNGLGFRIIGDEAYHNMVIASFATDWPTPDISDYPATSTPLSYLLWTTFGKVVGFELWKLRLLTAIATYMAVSLFYSLCKRRKMPYPLLSALIFLFSPYIFFHGFTIYTDSFGTLFGVWSLHYYLMKEATPGQLLKGSLLATLAIYSRQSYLVLPVGMLLFELWQTNRLGLIASIRQRSLRFFIFGLPVVLVMPLFLLWGGFTTPVHQAGHGGDFFVQIVLEHLNFMPIFVGFYFLPIIFNPHTIEMLRSRKIVLLAVVILLPFYFSFTPIHSEERDLVAAATGIIAHGLDILGQILGSPITNAAKIGLWAVGLLMILGEVTSSSWSAEKSKILVFLAAFLILITLTPYVSERYYALTVPYLILLLHRSFRHRRLLIFWMTLQIALSVGFSYWQIALKSFDAWY